MTRIGQERPKVLPGQDDIAPAPGKKFVDRRLFIGVLGGAAIGLAGGMAGSCLLNEAQSSRKPTDVPKAPINPLLRQLPSTEPAKK